MFYAVRLCGNPGHRRYQRPIEFMLDGDDPIETETEEEMEKALEDHPLYVAGWVQIIEID